MTHFWDALRNRREKGSFASLLAGILVTILLLLIPTGFEDAVIYQGADQVRATVLSVDNQAIVSSGLIQSGEQYCSVRLEGGRFKGEVVTAFNLLSGSMELDKIFAPGDSALVTVSYQDGQIQSVNMVDHCRIAWEGVLALVFVLLLVVFAGWAGVRAILSFLITVLAIWKILVPCCLRGYDPIWVGLAVVLALTVMIIVFVYGFDSRSLSAVLGSMLGVVTTGILGVAFTGLLRIHGAVMQNSESLLYSGYQHLDLTRIFMASIFIGASGAMMDLAVDITSGVYEVVCKRPDISAREAVFSGLRIGRAAMGTMTTTLLLAYSGGYLSLLMVFMAQGTPLINILNYKYVSSEILHTLVGSFGLVTVAPFTAVVSGVALTRRAHEGRLNQPQTGECAEN